MTMSNHVKMERGDRLFLIEKYIGIGTPVKEIPATSTKFGGHAKATLTTTGIIIVHDHDTLVTIIVPTFRYVKRKFYNHDLIPWEMQLALSRNKKYAEVLATIESEML